MKYLVCKYDKKGRKKCSYENIPSNVSYWKNQQMVSYKEHIPIIWRSEVVKNKKERQVYYVCVYFPSGEIWEYFLKASKRNSYIFKNIS